MVQNTPTLYMTTYEPWYHDRTGSSITLDSVIWMIREHYENVLMRTEEKMCEPAIIKRLTNLEKFKSTWSVSSSTDQVYSFVKLGSPLSWLQRYITWIICATSLAKKNKISTVRIVCVVCIRVLRILFKHQSNFVKMNIIMIRLPDHDLIVLSTKGRIATEKNVSSIWYHDVHKLSEENISLSTYFGCPPNDWRSVVYVRWIFNVDIRPISCDSCVSWKS